MRKKSYRECVENSISSFKRYDRDADIVTCWEAFTRSTYRYEFGNFHFDRFPSIHTDSPSAEPSFTIFFDSQYGIVGDVYHDLPALLDEELERIEGFDQGLNIKKSDGRKTVPGKFDIVLLVDSDSSQTLAHKIKQRVESGDFELDNNLIILEFDYIGREDQPKYRFKRLPNLGSNFQDNELPKQKRLSRRLSPEGGKFENLRIPVDEQFSELKATGVLTNKAPPQLYLACRLWNDVLYHMLDESDRKVWQKGDAKKSIEISVDCDDLTDKLNTDYVPDANIRQNWVYNALEYLAICKVAEQTGSDRFRVKFRNLRDHRRKYKDVTTAADGMGDLARLLAKKHCENKVEASRDDLEDIITADDYSRSGGLEGVASQDVTEF